MRRAAERSSKAERQERYRKGLSSELIAVLLLTAKGCRILARRVRTPFGELDIVARRANRLAFVEVKRRATLDEALLAITPRQRQRIMRASDGWLKRFPAYFALERSFDLILIAPRRLPRHLPDAFEAAVNPV